MKKVTLTAVGLLMAGLAAFAQKVEYKVLTSVESIVPMGVGRSIMVENKEEANLISADRTNGSTSNLKGGRKEAKIDNFGETRLLNFYSGVGINFQNIASNDAIIQTKMNELAKEGWELSHIASGVESDAGEHDGKGIFITRYIFKRKAYNGE
ncbi:MAG: hypothetical protein BGO31_11530 [Bacteroidetes bacterium 43-16]|nr:MAG: hypothetical protein BGO31_11530 [Bacteroidetes bacterium 43-16]